MKQCTYCGKEHPDDATVCTTDGSPLIPIATPKSPPPLHEPSSSKSPADAGTKTEIRTGLVFLGVVLLLIAIPLILQWRNWRNDELRLEWPMRDGSKLSIQAPRKLLKNGFRLGYVQGEEALEFEKLVGPAIFVGDDYWRASGPLVLDFPDQTRRAQAGRIEEYVARQQRIFGYTAAADVLGGIVFFGIGLKGKRIL